MFVIKFLILSVCVSSVYLEPLFNARFILMVHFPSMVHIEILRKEGGLTPTKLGNEDVLKQKYSSSGFCTGLIVNQRSVLSAAHCFEQYNSRRYVIDVHAGDEDFMKAKQTSRVNTLVIHPQYNKETRENDVAILKLENELQLNRGTIRADGFSNAEVKYESGKGKKMDIEYAGWGKTNTKGKETFLTLTTGKIVQLEKCKINGVLPPPGTICVMRKIPVNGKPAEVQDDDSGGPLFRKDDGVIGFLTRGPINKDYLLFTKVEPLSDWIYLMK